VILPATTAPPKEREAAVNKLFPPLSPLPVDAEPISGPNGRAMSLADLQSLALNNSPLIRQAAADVEAARGAAIQAGVYPNPVIGWAQDEVGTSHHGPSELGVFIGQTFVLGGKLTLARAMAKVDVQNAELSLKKARSDLAGQVRANYFSVLVARKNVQVSHALARFTDEIYRVQVDQVKLAQAAAYEPRQLRVFALQARNSLTAARNRDDAAWKQLAATLGMAKMPPMKLIGSVDMPVPVYRYDAVLSRMLKEHTDVLTAQNADQKARIGVQRARAMVVPDVTLNMHMNKFFSENGYVHSLDIQFPLPIYDRNKGGIMQAQGNLVRAVEEPRRIQADLTARLAEAFERYNTNRQILEEYRDHILADQMEAYLGAFERHQQEPDKVGFGDVVAAQQALATSITSYVSTLGNVWQAVADVSTLLQTNDLFQVDQNEQWPAIPDLDNIVPSSANPRPRRK
jgi:cobalt-zinc-cadmium efflux system outer membrane protein